MTAPVLPWLPDRHLGAVATLAHADELISQVGDLLFAYLRSGDVIAVREGHRDHKRVKELAAAGTRTVPAWLSVETEALRGTVVRMPNRDEIDAPVQEHLIVELYSR